MKELKDIVLKKGDIISADYGIYGIAGSIISVDGIRADKITDKAKILKIERPIKYETIYEAPKQILDKEEKEWLKNFLRPFKSKEVYIEKIHNDFYGQYIKIQLKNYMDEDEFINLPYFEKDTMYKGMELDKKYTLEELGLFEGE